jgi:cytochrome d ubiquinol oxidase subunit II
VYISFTARPWGIIFPIIAILGLLGAGFFNVRKLDMAALLSSGIFILGMLATAAFSLYPLVLPAVKPIHSLTINNASASQYGLVVGLIWWSVGILLASIYLIITYRRFWGKVTTASSQEY